MTREPSLSIFTVNWVEHPTLGPLVPHYIPQIVECYIEAGTPT